MLSVSHLGDFTPAVADCGGFFFAPFRLSSSNFRIDQALIALADEMIE
jgi:hypothetical protein